MALFYRSVHQPAVPGQCSYHSHSIPSTQHAFLFWLQLVGGHAICYITTTNTVRVSRLNIPDISHLAKIIRLVFSAVAEFSVLKHDVSEQCQFKCMLVLTAYNLRFFTRMGFLTFCIRIKEGGPLPSNIVHQC